MRLLITFTPTTGINYNAINKHTIQGMIYSLLKNTEYGEYHNIKRFKFFTFSDIFPLGNFIPKERKNLLISSPDPKFIRSIKNDLKERDYLKLGSWKIEITSYKTITLKPKNRFISGSPIVLYKDNRKNLYFSFKRDNDLNFFVERLKDNACLLYTSPSPRD